MTEDLGGVKRARKYSWDEAWRSSLLRPSVKTFQGLLDDPGATPARAYRWLVLSGSIGTLLVIALTSGVGLTEDILMSLGVTADTSPILALLGNIAIMAIGGLVLTIAVAVNVAISQFVARIFGGMGTYPQLLYAYAAFTAPIEILLSVLSFTPVSQCLAPPIGLYTFTLQVIAIRAVNRFSWARAVASNSTLVIMTILLCALCAAPFVYLFLLDRPR